MLNDEICELFLERYSSLTRKDISIKLTQAWSSKDFDEFRDLLIVAVTKSSIGDLKAYSTLSNEEFNKFLSTDASDYIYLPFNTIFSIFNTITFLSEHFNE